MSDGTAIARKERNFPLKTVIVAAIVIVVLISTTVFFYHFNGDSLDFSNREILTVPTNSMEGESQDYPIPTIPEDSLIMVHLLSDDEKKDLKVGDVVTFHQGGIDKVHRIIEIRDNGTLVTKGDNNQSADAPITYGDVFGKVVGVSVNVGKVVSGIRTFVNSSPILIIIGIVLLIIMIATIIEIIGIVKEKPTDDDGKSPPNQ